MKIINTDPPGNEEHSVQVFWKRKNFWVILLLLAAAAAFYQDSLHEILAGIRQITWRELLHSILFSLAAYFLEGMTIACMMSANRPGSGIRVGFPIKRGTAIAYLCEFYRLLTLGSGSGFAEIYYLHKSGIAAGTATVLTMFQYVCKRIAILFWGCLGFVTLFFGHGTMASCREVFREYALFMGAGCGISVGVIAAFLCVALSDKIAHVIIDLLDWLSRKAPSLEKKACEWKKQVVLLNHSGSSIWAQKNKIIYVILLQAGKLLLFYSIPAYLLRHQAVLSTEEYAGRMPVIVTGWLVCVLLMAVAYMLSGIIPTPSGAGSLEFVFLLFFSRFVKAQTALPAILVFRFATWIVPFLIGGVVKIIAR